MRLALVGGAFALLSVGTHAALPSPAHAQGYGIESSCPDQVGLYERALRPHLRGRLSSSASVWALRLRPRSCAAPLERMSFDIRDDRGRVLVSVDDVDLRPIEVDLRGRVLALWVLEHLDGSPTAEASRSQAGASAFATDSGDEVNPIAPQAADELSTPAEPEPPPAEEPPSGRRGDGLTRPVAALDIEAPPRVVDDRDAQGSPDFFVRGGVAVEGAWDVFSSGGGLGPSGRFVVGVRDTPSLAAEIAGGLVFFNGSNDLSWTDIWGSLGGLVEVRFDDVWAFDAGLRFILAHEVLTSNTTAPEFQVNDGLEMRGGAYVTGRANLGAGFSLFVELAGSVGFFTALVGDSRATPNPLQLVARSGVSLE